MSSSTPQLSQHLIKKAREAVTAVRGAFPSRSTTPKEKARKPEHGQHIYVYHQLQRNQIVYSLTKAMNNSNALSQIPYNGKKSVPSALRKDMWHPFCTLIFPSASSLASLPSTETSTPSKPNQKPVPGRLSTLSPKHTHTNPLGLSVFQKLREYRRRHELEWRSASPASPLLKMTKHRRTKALMDQKANSVADMAAVLTHLSPVEEGSKEERPNIGLAGAGSGAEVKILWRNVHDAEFAATWTSNVEHGEMEMHTNWRVQDDPLLEKKTEWTAAVREEVEKLSIETREAKVEADRVAEEKRQKRVAARVARKLAEAAEEKRQRKWERRDARDEDVKAAEKVAKKVKMDRKKAAKREAMLVETN